MRRLVLAFAVVALLALAGGSAAQAKEHFGPKEKAVILTVAQPKLCQEIHSTLHKYGYELALAGFELAFSEHPAYATPNVFRWVVKEC
jgi:hypothetical protein